MDKDEKRRPKRRHLIYYSEVLDRDNKAFKAHIVDISLSGFMLLVENELEINKVFRFELELPNKIDNKEKISFWAKSMWCKKDTNPDYYAAGFEIEEIAPEDEKIIVALMYEYGFKK